MKYIFAILLLSLTLISCGQTSGRKRAEKEKSINQSETKIRKTISDSTNKLIDKVENLEVDYTVWGCACPQWIRTKENESNDTTKNYLSLHFYLEKANKQLELPIYFDPFRHKLKVQGKFYEREDYPQGTIEMEEQMPKAKVFQYTKLEVIDNPNFKLNSKIETLILSYNAIACTCAQWSETKKLDNDPEKKINYWLEPANEKLIQADTLFNGENLPVQVKVTGQIISEDGFPKREISKAGKDEAGKVFRYSKIEILKK